MAKVYIDENVKIKTDKAAEEALAKQSDAVFLEKDGVMKITEERWKLAQKAEAKHWMELGKGANDDRNHQYAHSFNDYNSLSGRTFEHAVEFGCGPFTNLRLIGGLANIKSCTLIDPLAEQYLRHKNCQYKDGKNLLSSGKKILANVLSIPGEKAPDLKCDLVVCINVLEHCYDAGAFFEKLWNTCSSGGYFVFHDKVFTYDKAKKSVEDVYDAAHPLRIGKEFTMNFLSRFIPVHEFYQGVRNEMIDATQDYVYFIGRKK
jgi:SAM-dependent methyltransferase